MRDAIEHRIEGGHKKCCTPAALNNWLQAGSFHIGVVRADSKQVLLPLPQASTRNPLQGFCGRYTVCKGSKDTFEMFRSDVPARTVARVDMKDHGGRTSEHGSSSHAILTPSYSWQSKTVAKYQFKGCTFRHSYALVY